MPLIAAVEAGRRPIQTLFRVARDGEDYGWQPLGENPGANKLLSVQVFPSSPVVDAFGLSGCPHVRGMDVGVGMRRDPWFGPRWRNGQANNAVKQAFDLVRLTSAKM